MNVDKNLTLIFRHFEQEHLGKDVFLVPYYLGKQLHCRVTIVYPKTVTNAHFPETIHGVRLVPLRMGKGIPLVRTWRFYFYLLKHARHIDLLIRFHYSLHTMLMIVIYKLLNSGGKVYVKLDKGSLSIEKAHHSERCLLRRMVSAALARCFIKNVDRVSCETVQAYQLLKESPLEKFRFGDKLVLIPNGFDEELLKSYKLKERTFAEKENLIITVGRLGTPPKNTEMFLRALECIDLGEWTVCLIGPIEKSFQPHIDTFFERHPEKKNKIIFTGPVYDKKELWEYYNRAKVFVLTSSWESYGLVLNEAKRFRNYLVSTPVGAFADLADGDKYGRSIQIDDDSALSGILSDIIQNKKDIDVYQNLDTTYLSWENMLKRLAL